MVMNWYFIVLTVWLPYARWQALSLRCLIGADDLLGNLNYPKRARAFFQLVD